MSVNTIWQTKKIGEITEICLGLTHTPNYVISGIPFLSVTNITGEKIDFSRTKFISSEEFESMPYGSKPKVGDVLFCRVGTIGSPKILEEDVKFGIFVSLGFFRPNSELVINKYLYYWMLSSSFEKQVYDNVQGGVLKNLNTGWLKNFNILLPPLEVQKEITAKLDEKFAQLREAEKLRKEALLYTEKILSQNLREIFEEGKAKGWEEVFIGETCSLMTGATPSTSRKDYYGGNIKWLVSGDIHNKEIFDCEGRINELGVKNSNAKLLPKNSLLIALNGQGKTKGTVSILRVEATCNQSLVAIIPKNNILVEYLYYCLNFQYKNIRGMAGNDSRKGLNMKIIREISYLLPSLSEQQKIVSKLDNLSEKIESLRELQKSQLQDLKLLEKSYLREAFNGELI
jgi:type I restriction enzyme S subunit